VFGFVIDGDISDFQLYFDKKLLFVRKEAHALHKMWFIFCMTTVVGGATSSGDGRGSCRAPPDEGCCVLGRVFGFNHKIMINV
jgi:hypothetical protein